MLLTISLAVYGFIHGAWNPALALAAGEVSFRITSVSFVLPVGIALCIVVLVLVAARLAGAHAVAVKVEVPLAWLCIITLIAIPIISIAGAFLQHWLFPKYGYSYCNLLSGNPTVWFNDWVKNPEWCVRGKTHDWVREQAAKVQQHKSQEVTPQ
jgi:hypothetical protein